MISDILNVEAIMRRLSFLFLLLMLTFSSAAFAQSLGDVARRSRQKEKLKTKTAKKVVTNDEIPESPNLTPAAADAEGKAEAGFSRDSAEPRTAREWRNVILIQKDRVETMQAHINKEKASIHFIGANDSVNAAEYNLYQLKKQQEVKHMQKELDEEQKKLVNLQEAARKEGMGASVYDPFE